MESPITLNLLWLIPALTWLATRNTTNKWKSILRGASFGLVVAPASTGLYSLYYVGPIAAIFGMLGLVLAMVHESVGYNIAVFIDVVPSHSVVTDAQKIPIEIINSLFWATIYGLLGLLIWYLKNKFKKI